MKVAIADLMLDSRLQPREEMSKTAIGDYAELYESGVILPPITVYRIDGVLNVVDGFHRIEGAKAAGVDAIEADVMDGTFDEALLYVASVNATHGVRRTNKDKKRQIEIALSVKAEWSDREIARHCGVSADLVGKYRKILTVVFDSEDDVYRTYRTKHGTIATMNTALIGNGHKPELQIETESEPERQGDSISRDEIESAYVAPLVLEVQKPQESRPRSLFNQVNENIDWAKWSWNPVTGCEHNCVYCYARDIAERFYEEKFKPTFHPERLSAPHYTKPHPDKGIGWKNVFVCSMADLFGKWVPQEWIDAVMTEVRAAPQWNFLFLTKFPQRLADIDWPHNAWVGTSVDEQYRVKIAERYMAKVNAPVRWLSVEPFRERLTFTCLDMFDWVVMGGQSRSSQAPAFQPQWEWVESLTNQARAAGCMIYWKPNLYVRPQEYPDPVPSLLPDSR